MIVTRQTWAVLALALVLALLNLLPRQGAEALAPLPELPALAAADVTRIEVTRSIRDKVAMVPAAEGWDLVSGADGEADPAQVKSLLALFADPLPMDARVDRAELDTYGLDDGNRILVELFAGDATPALSFVLGWDGPGGMSFVRLPGDDAIYRARVGGRARYDRNPEAWRNLLVVAEEPEAMVGFTVDTPSGRVGFQRVPSGELDPEGNPRLGPWSLAEGPPAEVDARRVAEVVEAFSTMRAGAVLASAYDGGWDPPGAVVTLRDRDGAEVRLVLGSRTFDGACFVRREGREGVYRVSEGYLRLVQAGAGAFRNLQMFSFERTDVATLRLSGDGGIDTTLEQLPDGMWKVTEPPNVFADVKLILFAVNTLADLRGLERVEVDLAEAGLTRPDGGTLRITMTDGTVLDLRIGRRATNARKQGWWYVDTGPGTQVYTLSDPIMARLRRAFGRPA